MTDEMKRAMELAELPARKRPVLLIADRKTLAEMTTRAEIHPWIAGVLDLYKQRTWWNPGGYLAAVMYEAGEDLYAEKSAVLREAGTSEMELVARLGAALKFTIPPIWLAPSIADDVFKFDHLNSVENGKFYLLHPVTLDHYVLATDYPQRVLLEMHAAFVNLAAALGAKSLKLTSVTSTESKKGGGLKLPVEEINGVLGITASFDESGSVTYSHEKTFNRQMLEPHVPVELKPWVETDTSLRAMANLRLRNGITTDRVSISVSSKFGIDAELLAKVGDREAAANAVYRAAATSSWHFVVEYHPL